MSTAILRLLPLLLLTGSLSAFGQGPGPSVAVSGGSAPPTPQFVTRQKTFAIPFSVNGTQQPVEVHLYLSRDAGASWQLVQRQLPAARQFTFQAPADGDYWFASRTITASRPRSPDPSLSAELRVVVDTAPPELQFTARATPDGQVIASWRAADPHLQPHSLRIEYQSEAGQPWQPVSLTTSQPEPESSRWQAEQRWRPRQRVPVLNLRAEIQDRAGNRTVVNRRLLLPAAGGQQLASGHSGPRPSSSPFARRGAPSAGAVTWPRDDNHTPPAGAGLDHAASVADRPTAGPPAGGLAPQARSLPSPPQAPSAWPQPAADQRSGTASGTGAPAADRWPSMSAQQPGGPSPTAENSSWPAPPWDPAQQVPAQPAGGQHSSPEAAASMASNPQAPPALDGPFADGVSSDRGGLVSAAGQLPPGERPQMTDSSQFQLEYDVQAVGSSGVAEVQLWATEDGGQTWRLWGSDDDCQSPFEVQVDREGIYGFCVVIVSNSGLVGPRPRSGDLADIWVGVDTTAPVAELIGARYGENQQAGKLIIQWRAEDAGLPRRPVSLFFAESPDGPWSPIATGLPNSGQYQWPADAQLPAQVYLRLEVTDQAGNVTTDQTEQPIRLSGLAPKARIRGLMRSGQSLDREAFREPRPSRPAQMTR